MKLEPEHFCPLIQGECRKLGCSWFTHIQGHNPQTDTPFDEWACAVAMLPMLLIENTNINRGTGAAVDALRDDVNKSQQQAIRQLEKTLIIPPMQIGSSKS